VITTFSAGAAEAHLASYLDELERTLAAPFLFGSTPCIADFSLYHCLWLIANNPVVAPLLDGHPNVTAWRARIAAFGHGRFENATPESALAAGTVATPAPAAADRSGLPPGLGIGDDVTVTPTDYGLVPVRGRLVTCSRREVAIARNDARAGDVVVHFPRIGFVVEKV